MKVGPAIVLLLCSVVGGVLPAFGQAARQDVMWARRTTGTITLDGLLTEPAWAQAESVVIKWAVDSGIPGSGWKVEGGLLPSDPTFATIKLLVKDNQMYMAARVRDKSIGGSMDFNRFDGLLMDIKDHTNANAPKPPAEYFYSWWYPNLTNPMPPGQAPAFAGKWATELPGLPRTPAEVAAWDAVTVVHGTSNDDAANDTDYTVEMRFDLTPMGYDVTKPAGDIVEWNISIYDCDWLWPIDVNRLSYNRVWLQDPWGNDAWYGEMRVCARPDVQVGSGAVPAVGPEYVVHDGYGFVAPTIDGSLSDPIWATATPLDIRYGDDGLRQTYAQVGPYRAGQFQPAVNGGQAAVLDPADATVKMLWKDHTLYLSFDMRDQLVQYHPNFDRWDGAIVSINDVKQRGPDHNLLNRRLSFQVAQNGTAQAQDFLLTLVQQGAAHVALQLKPGTTVDTLGVPDTGYTAEMSVDLTKLGYSTSLGDGTLFIGVDILDGDSLLPPSDSYGTRTWWYREWENKCCAAWAYMAPTHITDAGDPAGDQTDGYVLVGSSPNPSQRTTIRYALPRTSHVLLEVYDVRGRLVEKRALGSQAAGPREVAFDGSGYSAGMYLYQLLVSDPETGSLRKTLSGRLVVVK